MSLTTEQINLLYSVNYYEELEKKKTDIPITREDYCFYTGERSEACRCDACEYRVDCDNPADW